MPVFTAEQLTRVGFSIFKTLGSPEEEARLVSEFLVEANLTGHDSHGVIRMPRYVEGVRGGHIKPGAKITVLEERPSTAIVDGNWGFGQTVATRAMELAIEKARKCGISSVGVRHCHHIGRLNTYSEMAVRADMIGITVCNSRALVAPYGGKERLLGTNPICLAVPAGEEGAFVLDMATAVHAWGKVLVRLARGELCPEGFLLDADGRPTQDPEVINEGGTIRPLGCDVGYKGYGLCLFVDVLGGILTGAGGTSSPEYIARPFYAGNGVFIMVINIGNFVSVDIFKSQMDSLIRRLKSSAIAPGFSEILIPGEPEARERRRRLREGIFVEDATWSRIRAIAEGIGVDVMKIVG